MAKIVVLCTNASSQEDTSWAKQFVDANDQVKKEKEALGLTALDRSKVLAPLTPTWDQIVSSFDSAATEAGSGGVVMAIGGHGASPCISKAGAPQAGCSEADLKNGMLSMDLNNSKAFDQDVVFYDVKATTYDLWTPAGRDKEIVDDKDRKNTAEGKAAAARLKLRADYDKIGKALKAAGVARVVLLSCAVGNSTKFVDKLAKDWGVQVGAYRFELVMQMGTADSPKGSWKSRMYLNGRAPLTAADRAYSEVYIPSLKKSNDAYLTPA